MVSLLFEEKEYPHAKASNLVLSLTQNQGTEIELSLHKNTTTQAIHLRTFAD